MNVLWLNAGLLLPLDKGGKLRTWHLMRHLARHHAITYLSFTEPDAPREHLDGMQQVCDRLVTVTRRDVSKGSARFYVDAARYLLNGASYAVAKYRSEAYADKLRRLLREQRFDLVVCDFLPPIVNLPAELPCPSVLFTHNVEAEIWRRHVEAATHPVKRALLRSLAERGLEMTVLPHDATAAQVAALDPDLVVLSPGPGDPSRMAAQIAMVGELARAALAGGPPILGVCLGHQLLALAAGGHTRRLAVGHHGGNHAVIELASGRVDIGAHNHEVEVLDGPALAEAGYAVSHRDLNDGTVEGLIHASGRIAAVQFHPEGAPGPTDASRVFDLAVERATR